MNSSHALCRWLRDNSLSLVLVVLFAAFLAGHAFSGWLHHNDEQRSHGVPEASFGEYLRSGDFGESVFENWESEFLQMSLYVVLTAWLFQRGSAESRDPDAGERSDASPSRTDEPVPLPVRRGGLLLFLYSHSLSMAFLILFLISFAGHALCGWRAVNAEALAHGRPAESLGNYLISPTFWFESLQNWQSEFLAIFAIVVLSIWLREKGSPESKPVDAPHQQTGG